MWRVEKVWGAGEENKLLFCRVPIKNTRQQHHFAECQKTLGKNISLPSVNKKHSANLVFAECL